MENFEIIKEWLFAFGQGVNEKIVRNHVTSYGNLLWHLFTWGDVPCLEGTEAREAFDGLKYTEAIVFYDGYSNHIEGVSCVGKLTSDDLDRDDHRDVYVVAKDISWTYVRTHERDCGPFFCVRC